MIEHAPFEVVAYAADGSPTTRGDAVVARRPDGWGLAREAMSPGHALRVVAPADGPEPWLRGPDAVVELRTPGDDRWYPVDREGEWAAEGFADPWAALAVVKARPTLRAGKLARGGRGTSRVAALRRLGDDDAYVALRFGRRVVVWPVNECEVCDGAGCVTCGGEGRVTRGGNRRFWVDGPGAPAELLRAEQAAAAVDVLIGTTNAATEARRAAWGLDMPNRGEEPPTSTVRQREVLSRVGATFTLAELQESACHRYAGHTRRMAADMVARGAVEALSGERFRKTALAVPSCARVADAPTKVAQKPAKASKRPRKAAKAPKKSTKAPKTPAKAEPRSAGRGQKSGPTPEKPAAPAKPVKAAAQSKPAKIAAPARPVKFAEFQSEQDGRDNQNVHISPDRRTALLRSERAWWVLHRFAERLWRVVAGPLAFSAARREALAVASQPPAMPPLGALQPTPNGIELTDEGRGVIGTVDAILRRMLAVAAKGDRVDLSPLALGPFVARLSGLEERDAERWWTRVASWTIENDRRSVVGHEVARAVAAHHSARFEPPAHEHGDGFDLGWLKYKLRALGCAQFRRMTDRFFAVLCGPDGKDVGLSIRQRPDGWVWSRHRDPDAPDRGPFARASALLADVVERLKLPRSVGTPQKSGPAAAAPAAPTFVLIGCVKAKGEQAAAARDLYRGALWDLRRRYAEARGLPWAIVSGGLGVVGPDERVEPYDKRVEDHTPAQRKAWQKQAQEALERLAGRGAVVEVIAARAYVEALAAPAKALGVTLVAPLAGKGIGARKKWLNLRIHELRGDTAPKREKRPPKAKTPTAKATRAQLADWSRSGDKPPFYTAPSKQVRFSQRGLRGYYRVEQRSGDGWVAVGADHRTFQQAARAALALAADTPLARSARPSEDSGPMPQAPLLGPIDVGEPPTAVPDDRRLAWMIRQAADALGRPTRGVWLVVGRSVHPIGALPDGVDVNLPTVFVDMNPAGEVAAVESDPGFLLAIEPVNRALRRYRMRLDEDQRERLLTALRMARGEGFRTRWKQDRAGIKRRFEEGFKREQVVGDREVWTDKSRTMNWAAPKGATDEQVIDGFFAEMARRLAAELPEAVRERAEKVLARAFRMARRQAPKTMKPRMARGAAPKPPKAPSKSRRGKPPTPPAGGDEDERDPWDAMVAALKADLALHRMGRPFARVGDDKRRSITWGGSGEGLTVSESASGQATVEVRRRVDHDLIRVSFAVTVGERGARSILDRFHREGPDVTAPSANLRGIYAERWAAFLEKLPEDARRWLALLKERGVLTAADAEAALGADRRQIGAYISHINAWAAPSGVALPYAERPDGAWLWAGARPEWRSGDDKAARERQAALDGPDGVRGYDERGHVEWESSLADFCESNAEDAELCARVTALPAGGKLAVGGGAAPDVEIRRRPTAGWPRAKIEWFTVTPPKTPSAGKTYLSPDGLVLMFRTSLRRSGAGWWVLRKGPSDQVWRVFAGPEAFKEARKNALRAQFGRVEPLAELAALPADTGAALLDPGKAAAGQIRGLLAEGPIDRLDLTKLVGSAARVERDPTKASEWRLVNDGSVGSADAIAKRLGRVVDMAYVPPPERDDGFDLGWLRRELQRHGCDRLGAVSGGIHASLCPRWGGKQYDLIVRQLDDGWYWSGLGDDSKGRGPWKRARDLFADVRDRLGLRPIPKAKPAPKPAAEPSPAETIIGLADYLALSKSKRPKYLVAVKDAAGLVVHLFQKAAARDAAHQAARGMLAVSPGMKLLVGKVDPKQTPEAFFEHVRALQKVDRLRLDLTEALAGGVPSIGSGPSCPVPDVAADAPPSARTAIRRPELSRGARVALDRGLISKATTVLDFGSGNGDDVCHLQAMGIDAVGWDPHREPPGEERPSDVVLVTNVLNTLYPGVRAGVLHKAITLARVVTVVSVPDYRPEGTPKDDGVITAAGTFQAALDAEAIEALLPDGVSAERLDARIVAIRPAAAASPHFELIPHHHTKRGYAIWVAKPRERWSEDDFKALKRLARDAVERHGDASDSRPSGYYSRYAKDGAIPGFTFVRAAEAEAFIAAADRLLRRGAEAKAPPAYADATKVNKKGAAILEVLTAGMHATRPKPDTVVWRRIGEPGAAVMPLSIDRLGDQRFAVAHNFIQNGDVVPDPDVELFRAGPGQWIPLAIQQPMGYRRFGEAGKLRDRAGQRDLARFVGSTWMQNVAAMLLDGGALPARRAETLYDGTERELGRPTGPFADAARVNAASATVLETLTEGMHGEEVAGQVMHRRFGEPPLAVDWLGERAFAVFEYAGNLDVAETTVEFARLDDGGWVPIGTWTPVDKRFATSDGDVSDPIGQRALARFVDDTWMPAIRRKLDGGRLPARRYEQYVGGGQLEVGQTDAEALDDVLADLRGNRSGVNVFGYRPADGQVIDVGFDGVGAQVKVGSLLSKILLHGNGPWWVIALRGAGAPRESERENAARLVEAGALTGAAIERVLLDADRQVHDLLADDPEPRSAGGAQKSGPAPATPAAPASEPWPATPDKKAPRTIANLRAVRIAHEAQRSGAQPTAEQRRQMLQYSGWGGLSIDAIRDDWPDGIPLLDAEALVHEYYTPWQVCADIVAAVRKLLGGGPAEVLEPSAGVGRFVHAVDAPDWRWTAIELSPLSALILEQTAGPNVEVVSSSFERWVDANPARRFDAVISNPPYGKRGAHIVDDKDKRFRVSAAYQYFVLRGLSLLKPGGIGAFLIPGGFMDGRSTANLRARVARDADLVAAFRLPSGIFPGARLSLDVVFLRAHAPGGVKAPDDAFQVGSYFDEHPAHVLGEVKPSGRWGGPEVIGEYTGLPDFDAPVMPSMAPASIGDDFPDAIRMAHAFVPLVELRRRADVARNHGGKFLPNEVPAVDDAVWRAAAEDVARSRRPKKARLELLRQILEDLRAAAGKAERFRQSARTDAADDAVAQLRAGRDAVKAAIAAVKAQKRRGHPRVTPEQMGPFAARFVDGPLAQLVDLPEWSALPLPLADARRLLPQLVSLGAVRVVAVDPQHAHARLTDAGRSALKVEPLDHAQQRSRRAARAIEQRGGTVRLRDNGRVEGRIGSQRFTLAMPKRVNGQTFGYRVTWDAGNALLDAPPGDPIAAVEQSFAAMGIAQPKPAPAPSTEPELPPLADRRRRPKAEAHARALRFASPANRLMEVWHVQGRAIATDNRRLAEIPSDYAGPSQFVDRAGREVPGSWEETPSQIARLLTQVHFTVNPALHGVFDGARFRSIIGHRGYDEPLLRLHDGQLYVESGDAAVSMQRHVGRASGPDMVFGAKQDQIRAALVDVRGAITLRLIAEPRPLTHDGRAVAWSMGPLVIDREDGERHVISGSDLRGHEATVVEIASRPLIAGPANALEMEDGAAPKQAPTAPVLARGFQALEMDDDAEPTKAATAPELARGFHNLEMERAARPLVDAITRAAFYVRPDDPILRGICIGEGRVIASDGGAMIEIAIDDTGPARVIAADGTPLDVDYPAPSELMPATDPLATIDPAPLGALDARLRKLAKSPVELKVDGPQLLLDGQRIPGATVAPGSVSGTWRFSLHRLRPAVLGAKSGRLLLGPATAPTIIERDDGQRIFLQCAVDPACEVCPAPTGPDDAPPPAPPRGPSEADLAALIARRLAAYQSADVSTQVLLYPELVAALDAFAEVFGRRLAALDRPLLAQPPVRGDAAARRLLVEHPAGVPLARIADPADLLVHGWRFDGERLLPRDDYLSGDLWARLGRLDAIPDGFRDAIARQRAELEDAIGDVSFAEIADRISLRDGWLPVRAIGGFLGTLRGNNRGVGLERREGVLQFRQPDGRPGKSYEDLLEFETSSPIRLLIGYINHDERAFRPKVSKRLGEDLNKKRRAVAEQYEQQFKAFLATRPDLRDAVVEAYRRAHRGFVPRAYSGAPLTLARWGSRVTPHPHQNAGARRAVDQRGMVAAYGVGVGKTFTACATVALARQKLGTRRPVILVPNSLVSKWQRDIHAALPDFAVVTIGEKATPGRGGVLRYGPDTKAERALKWARFRAGLYDLALVTPTAFMRTRVDADEFERLAAGATEIQRSVRLAQRNARGRENPTERQQAVLEQGVRAFLAQMLEPTWELDDVRWSQLGVDLLIVDEAQNYKGLHGPETREGSIPRFMGQTQPSKRAWNLDARAREVRARDGFVALLSATPAKNSPLELYNLWSYVNGELWRDHGIHDPEAFISRFLQIDPRLVVTATMEVEERPAVTAFKHLDELKAILLRWGEFIQPADIGLEVPEPTPEMVEVEMDPRQEAKYDRYVAQIEAELDKMRQGFKTNKVLGLLARMSLVSVHAELDRGLNYKAAGKGGIDPSSPKFDAIAEYILGNNACGHIVFLQAIAGHRWLKDTLVKRGIPADRIGVLNAELAQSSDARQRIADRFNEGRLDVVIANSIAYEGLDLQVRTCAIHHADLPWEPATLNQRNGRAVRQGNTLGAVAIRYYFASRSMDGLRFNLIQGKQGWMGALLEGSDAIANPGADLELGPDEVLLLISRTPEKTRAQLDKLRAKAEAKRREDEKERALKLLEMGAGQRLEARDAATPERSGQLRANADVVFDALARVDRDIWPWADLLGAARAADADEILARAETPPLFPGAWLRWEGDWYEVGRFGWQGTSRMAWLRRPGSAKWIAHKVAEVATRAPPEDVAPSRPADVRADDWQSAAVKLITRDLDDPYRGWPSTGWAHANPAWVAEAWPRVQVAAEQAIGRIRASAWGDSYGPKETRFPYDLDGAVYIHTRGGALPASAELLPPTAAGWARWLELATGDDFKLTVRSEASQWWWGRPLRRGMQRTRQNPSRPNPTRRPMFRWSAYRFAGAGSTHEHDGEAGMQLPPMTPIGSFLVLGVDHADRLVWLESAKTVTAAKALQKKVPADIPLVAIVRVENNARGERRPMAGFGGDPVFLRGEHLVDGAGLVIAADGADAITSVIHAPDLDGAYRANQTRVPARVPRTVIGTVRHRYRSAG